jgi:hypothetical protein
MAIKGFLLLFFASHEATQSIIDDTSLEVRNVRLFLFVNMLFDCICLIRK